MIITILLAILSVIAFLAVFWLFIIPWSENPNGAWPTREETLERIRAFWRLLMRRIRGDGSGPHPSLETTELHELNVNDSGPPTPAPGRAPSPQDARPMDREQLVRRGSDGDIRATGKEKTGGPLFRSMSEDLDRDKEKEL